MKEYNLKQSVVIVVAGFALLWMCLYFFIFPFLVGGGPAKIPRARMEERQLLLSMQNYRDTFGSYPAGEVTNILRTLGGENPKKLKFINLGIQSTNASGEFIDPWKTPYRIVFDGTNRVTISSAGIDRVFGDADDIIFSSVSNTFVKP